MSRSVYPRAVSVRSSFAGRSSRKRERSPAEKPLGCSKVSPLSTSSVGASGIACPFRKRGSAQARLMSALSQRQNRYRPSKSTPQRRVLPAGWNVPPAPISWLPASPLKTSSLSRSSSQSGRGLEPVVELVRAGAELVAERAGERREAAAGSLGEQRVARVVRMEALADVEVHVGPRPRREDQVGLRAQQMVGRAAADGHRSEVRVGTLHGQPVEPGEEVHVAAHPHLEPRPLAQDDLLLEVGAHRPLVDREAVDGKEAAALHLTPERQVNLVVAVLEAEQVGDGEPEQRPRVRPAPLRSVDPALVVLLDAVARHVGGSRQRRTQIARVDDAAVGLLDEAQARVLEEREVAEQRELVAKAVDLRFPGVRGGRRPVVVEVEVLLIRAPALGRIDRAEAVERAGGDGAERNLPGAVPRAVVERGREPKHTAGGGFGRELREEIVLREPLGVVEGTVGEEVLAGHERRHPAEAVRAAGHVALRAEGAAFGEDEVFLELVLGDEVDRAGVLEVAELDEVRALVEVDRVEGLGDEDVRVGVALAVGVGRQVHGTAVEEHREVGAVIGVEAAHEVLRGLAPALMLRDDHAGQVVQELKGRVVGLEVEAARGEVERRGGRYGSFGLDDDLAELWCRIAGARPGGGEEERRGGGEEGTGPQPSHPGQGRHGAGQPVHRPQESQPPRRRNTSTIAPKTIRYQPNPWKSCERTNRRNERITSSAET